LDDHFAILEAQSIAGSWPGHASFRECLDMNNAYVFRNLHEAKEELQKAIEAVETDDFGPFMVSVVFTYRKLNRAWNCINLTPEELLSESNDEYEARCQFPHELSGQIAGRID
jgi:hypothetical protein